MTRRIEWCHFQVNPREKFILSILPGLSAHCSAQKWKCRFHRKNCLRCTLLRSGELIFFKERKPTILSPARAGKKKIFQRDFSNLTSLLQKEKRKKEKREKNLSLSLFRSNIYKWRVKNCFNTQDKPMTTELSFNESQCKNCSIVYDTRVE